MAKRNQVLSALIIFSLVVSSLLVTTQPVQAGNTITVNTFEDKYGGSTHCSLREAIQAANTDTYFAGCNPGYGADTIVLKAGTYRLTRLDLNDGRPGFGDLDITSDITIIGQGSQETGGTQIDASLLYDRAIGILPRANSSIKVKLTRLSITGGNTEGGSGGGVLNCSDDPARGPNPSDHSALQLEDVVVKGNQVGTASIEQLGGGVFNGIGCSLSLSRSTITENQGGYGGGIFNYGTLAVTNSAITHNRATVSLSAGGLDSRPLIVTDQANITGSVISENTVTSNPQGIGGVSSGGRLTVQNSAITANTGAGLQLNAASTATVSGSTIAGNSSDGLFTGGASQLSLADSQVYQNGRIGLIISGGSRASISGVNIYKNGAAGLDANGNITMTGSYLAENSGVGIILRGGGTIARTVTITSALVNQNSGAGIVVESGVTANITNSTITGNAAADPDSGAGIVSAGDLTLEHSTVAENGSSGLRVNAAPSPTPASITRITNSTIGANTAQGIVNAGELDLMNVTVAHNQGGGLRLEDHSKAFVQNTILAVNSGSNCTIFGAGSFKSDGYNLYDDPGSCLFDGGGDQAGNPMLTDELVLDGGPNRTYPITSKDSPAVDRIPAGTPGCPGVDQRWLARPVGSGCDIGAYEAGAIYYTSLLPFVQR